MFTTVLEDEHGVVLFHMLMTYLLKWFIKLPNRRAIEVSLNATRPRPPPLPDPAVSITQVVSAPSSALNPPKRPRYHLRARHPVLRYNRDLFRSTRPWRSSPHQPRRPKPTNPALQQELLQKDPEESVLWCELQWKLKYLVLPVLGVLLWNGLDPSGSSFNLEVLYLHVAWFLFGCWWIGLYREIRYTANKESWSRMSTYSD
jgi:hypothetical protein